jgi:hypothetical protein
MPASLLVKGLTIGGSILAAVAASIVAVFNFSDTIARLERMHSAYKMLNHSAETLAKDVIGAERLTSEQQAVFSMLQLQLASLGPQDEVDPDEATMKKVQDRAERQLPDHYFFPQGVEN